MALSSVHPSSLLAIASGVLLAGLLLTIVPAPAPSATWTAIQTTNAPAVTLAPYSLTTPAVLQRPHIALGTTPRQGPVIGPIEETFLSGQNHQWHGISLLMGLVAAAGYALFRLKRPSIPGSMLESIQIPYHTADLTMASLAGATDTSDPTVMARPPLQIFGEDESAFCYLTMIKRMPAIARDIITDNPFLTPAQAAAVEEVAKELEDGGHGICREVERLKADTTVPEKASEYERSLFQDFAPYVGKEWRDTPWLHGEIYFYHRILEATGWFSHQKDIFQVPKMKSLNLAEQSMITLTDAVVDDGHIKEEDRPAMLHKLIQSCLWGNKVDLCLFKVDDFSDSGVQSKGKGSNVMCDDTDAIVEYVKSLQGKGQMDFILDNFGYELFTDLVLTYFLLEYNLTERVVLHCKMQPYYVSDCLEQDVAFMLDHLISLNADSAKSIGRTLKEFHANGRLQWTSHPYWMAPMEFYNMPDDVRQLLSKSQLVFVKGDLNYRRLVGDRHWPYTTPFHETVSYFPTSLVALRTNKSEVLVGVDEEALAYVKSKEPEKWLVSGNFGVVQFWKP